jgi:hypothetical protein
MPIETVTVAFVNEPKPGKKYGSIKSEDGIYYSVKPEQLALFKAGGTYEIQYGLDKTGTYRNFQGISGASPSNPTQASNGHTKSVEMFVMGTIGRALQGSGTFPDAADLTEWVRSAREAWVNGFSDGSSKRANAPLDDEIPF